MKKNTSKILLLISIILSAIYVNALNEVELVGYVQKPCEEFYLTRYVQERVVEKYLKFDTLTVVVSIEMNCASGEKASLNIQGDTLKLYSDYTDSIPSTNEKGDTISWSEPEMADCSCYFTLEYKIKGLNSSNYIVIVNDKELNLLPNNYKLPTINEYGDTTAFIDEEGFLHTKYFNILGELKFEGKEDSSFRNTRMYYRNGKLKYERIFNKIEFKTTTREYDETGKLIKEEIQSMKTTNN